MNKLHFTALSLCLMAIGCTNDESFYEQSEIDDNGVVVLQERNAALPKEIRTRPVILEDKTATRAVNESGGIIGIQMCFWDTPILLEIPFWVTMKMLYRPSLI